MNNNPNDVELDQYSEGRIARYQNEVFDDNRPRPWQLGWKDADEQINKLEIDGDPDESHR